MNQSSKKHHLQLHREALQRRTQQDWANREYVQLMAGSITRIADFLNTFYRSCSGRLAHLDSRLTSLERKVIFLESKIAVDEIDEDEETFADITNRNEEDEHSAEEEQSCLENDHQGITTT